MIEKESRIRFKTLRRTKYKEYYTKLTCLGIFAWKAKAVSGEQTKKTFH